MLKLPQVGIDIYRKGFRFWDSPMSRHLVFFALVCG